MRWRRGALLALILSLAAAFGPAARGAELRYDLSAEEIAPGCYAVVGSLDYLSFENGGNIVNTGFIVTEAGVVVIDSGPSLRYGRELRALIEATAGGKPILKVIVTHLHPDHYLGSQAFAGLPILAGTRTIAGIEASGADFTLNLYRLSGDWMRGTESTPPNGVLEEGAEDLGGHRIRYLRFAGHSDEDFVVLDETCGVLYAQDLLFHERTPTVPHADPARWVADLSRLAALPFSLAVPGHGPVDRERRAFSQTRRYLVWLEAQLERAAAGGLDITEVMTLPIPEEFERLSQARPEFQRSVSYLYPAIEQRYLPKIEAAQE